MRGVHTLASTQAHRARISPSCGGSDFRPTTGGGVSCRFVSLTLPPSYPPSLHPRYGTSSLLRGLWCLPSAVLRACFGHERRFPARLAFPTSLHSNFQPSCLQPSQSSPSRPFCCWRGGLPVLAPSCFAGGQQVLGLRRDSDGSPNSETESSLTW